MTGRPQFVDAVSKEVPSRTAKFVTLHFKLCDERQALLLHLVRKVLQPFPHQHRLPFLIEDDLRPGHDRMFSYMRTSVKWIEAISSLSVNGWQFMSF